MQQARVGHDSYAFHKQQGNNSYSDCYCIYFLAKIYCIYFWLQKPIYQCQLIVTISTRNNCHFFIFNYCICYPI